MNLAQVLRKYFTVFFYLSLFFLLIYLVKYDYLRIPLHILNGKCLALSFLFLFSGFLVNAFCWYFVCAALTDRVLLGEAISSYGLTIFGKYVPGKVWGLMGRAAYVTKPGTSLKVATQLSFYAQFLSIWVGGALGITGLILIRPWATYSWGLLFLWLLVTAMLFFSPRRVRYFFNLDGNGAPYTYLTGVARKIPVFIVFWVSWTVGFFFLLESFSPAVTASWHASLAFPFASTLGILAFIAPGGLGVREGFLVYYLVNSGMSLEGATVISVTARIWFTVGEVFIFVVGMILRHRFRK